MAERLPTIQEVQQLVDDPKIDDETKRTLLVRYFDAIGNVDPAVYGFQNENEKKQLLESYQDRFDFADRDLKDGAYAYDAYSTAQGRHGANLNAAREEQQRAVDGGKARLDSLKGSDTSPGAGNSNEILDAGVPGLDSLRTWLPVYSKARAVAAPGLPDFRLQELIDRYDEQRDIPFDKFAAGANEIVQVRESVADAAPAQNSAMQTLFGSWEGDGKNAAAASWTKFGDGVKTVEQTLEHAADVVNRTIAAVAGSCRDKASWVLQYAFQAWPQQQGLTAQDTDRLARIAALGRNASADDFKHFIPFLMGQGSPLAGQLVVGSSFEMPDELLDAVQAWAKSWLAEFCGWFAGFVGEFQMMCENTRVAVAGQWSALNTELQKVPDNPFAGVDEAAPPVTRSAGSGGGSGGSGGAGGGGLAGGGSTGGGSAGGASVTPPVSAPVVPSAAAAPAPVPPADEQDTLTVQRGDSKLEMSEPDQHGRMDIKIDNGDGRPKDYQLNWGAADPAGPAYTPAADGKIHIDDGALRITAERPHGETGPTVVTVDDGTGTPTTYTLGEEPDAVSGAGSLPEAAQRATATPGGPGQASALGGVSGPGAGPVAGSGGVDGPGFGGEAGRVAAVDGVGGQGFGGGAGQVGALGGASGPGAGPVAAFGGGDGQGFGGDAGRQAAVGGGDAQGVTGTAGQAAAFRGVSVDQASGFAAGADQTVPGLAAGAAAGAPGFPGGAGAGQAAGDGGLSGVTAHSNSAAEGVPTGHPGGQQTFPASAIGGVADGLAAQGAVSGSLGDPGSLSHASSPAAGGAALGTAPGLAPVDPVGMGMPAAGQQGGDDPERTSRAYRVDGDIFDPPGSGGRISGSLDDEETRR